jgi:hypothetical protein
MEGRLKKKSTGGDAKASKLIDKMIVDLGDWRGKLRARLRTLILESAPDIIEEWKWNTAVWTSNGMVCAGGTFKDHVKLNFFKSASLKDPKRLFNAGLDAKATRAIDFTEDYKINEPALKALIREAVAYNAAS